MPQVKGQALRKRNCTRTSAVLCFASCLTDLLTFCAVPCRKLLLDAALLDLEKELAAAGAATAIIWQGTTGSIGVVNTVRVCRPRPGLA